MSAAERFEHALARAASAIAATAPATDAERKRFSRLQAVAAIAGIRVDQIEIDDGRPAWVVTRWALSRQCNSLDELTDFLRKMGVAA